MGFVDNEIIEFLMSSNQSHRYFIDCQKGIFCGRLQVYCYLSRCWVQVRFLWPQAKKENSVRDFEINSLSAYETSSVLFGSGKALFQVSPDTWLEEVDGVYNPITLRELKRTPDAIYLTDWQGVGFEYIIDLGDNSVNFQSPFRWF